MQRTYVGSLACQRDSFLLKGFTTTVVSSEPAGSKSSKKSPPIYHVELQDTILFPEGGGQPSDTGFLKILEGPDADETIPVSHVFRLGLHAKHSVSRLIEPGTKVEITVDSGKRRDYMQQHTGQHLLSAVLEKKFNLDTLSWSMGGVISVKKKCLELNDYFNYIEIARKLTELEIKDLSEEVNKHILVDPLPIKVHEATQDSVGDLKTHKIPDDYDLSKGIIRTIHIGDIDANPCCGTHLGNTGQIGSILISPSQTTVRGTNSRLYFMCGSRVTKYGEMANGILLTAKGILSCQEAQVPEKIARQKDQLQKSIKKEQYWMKELAVYESKTIVEQLKQNKKAFMLKDTFGTLEYLLQVLKEVSTACQEMSEYTLLLCGREKQTESGSVIVFSDSGESISDTVSQLSRCLKNLKGGGGKKGGKWQGKATNFTDQEWVALKELKASRF